jgi:hypothetical protein
MESALLNRLKQKQYRFPEEKHYLKIHEIGLYRMIKRRKMKLDETMLATYLRGKFVRFNKNPFELADKVIKDELNISRDTLRRIRENLQIKGLIEYEPGDGHKRKTLYFMLDTYMSCSRNGIENTIVKR